MKVPSFRTVGRSSVGECSSECLPRFAHIYLLEATYDGHVLFGVKIGVRGPIEDLVCCGQLRGAVVDLFEILKL